MLLLLLVNHYPDRQEEKKRGNPIKQTLVVEINVIATKKLIGCNITSNMQHIKSIEKEQNTGNEYIIRFTLVKEATIHQATTMLATYKNVIFPGHNHLLTTSADDLTL